MTFVNRPSAGHIVSTSLIEKNQVISAADNNRSVLVSTAGLSLASTAESEAVGEYQDLDAFIGEEDHAFWCFMAPTERPSFTRTLLQDLTRVQSTIKRLANPAGTRAFDYVVLGSRTPGVFNLGGDLVLFRDVIERGERERLRHYAHACVDVCHNNHIGYDSRLVTIALVQGDALGGGMEAALSCDLIIAERSAKFGLPEVLFNLFPGMGAYSFLSRRIGPVQAEEMILSGRVYTAEELHALGLVKVLAEDGAGEVAVRAYIAKHRGRHNAHSAVYQARRIVNPVTLGELREVTDLWVDAALRLSEADLRKMGRLAAAQDRARTRRTEQNLAVSQKFEAAE